MSVSTRNVAGGLSGRLAGLFHKRTVLESPPTLTEPKRFPYGQFQLQIGLQSQREFQVEATTDLRHWTAVYTAVAQRPTTEFLDPSAANYSHRFYRVRTGSVYSTN